MWLMTCWSTSFLGALTSATCRQCWIFSTVAFIINQTNAFYRHAKKKRALPDMTSANLNHDFPTKLTSTPCSHQVTLTIAHCISVMTRTSLRIYPPLLCVKDAQRRPYHSLNVTMIKLGCSRTQKIRQSLFSCALPSSQ